MNEELGLSGSPLPWDDWIQLVAAQMGDVAEKHPMWATQHVISSHKLPSVTQPTGAQDSTEMRLSVISSVRYLARIGFIKSSVHKLGALTEKAVRPTLLQKGMTQEK